MVNEYPSEAKVTHPDDVGKRRMPTRKYAENDIVKYSLGARRYSGKDIDQATHPAKDLGEALKFQKHMKEHHPDIETWIQGE